MNFSLEQHTATPTLEQKECVEVPVEIAIAFQTMLVKDFFQNENQSPFEYGNETIWEWIVKYGKAFRDFCDTHPEIAKHINAGIVTPDEGLQIYLYEVPATGGGITPEEMNELVAYLKANPAEEILETVH